jgi:hypothetical protein
MQPVCQGLASRKSLIEVKKIRAATRFLLPASENLDGNEGWNGKAIQVNGLGESRNPAILSGKPDDSG